MRRLILLLLFVGSLHASGEVVKVVFDLTAGDLQTFEKKVLKGIVAHKVHYEGRLQELEVSVVIHGSAYKFFVKEPQKSPFSDDVKLKGKHSMLKKRIASLAETYEVDFLMCRSGMNKLKLDPKDIYDFVSMVPNAAVGLIDRQDEGFAYIPISD